MLYWINRQLAVGTRSHRTDDTFDVVVSIAGPSEPEELHAPIQDKKVFHVNLDAKKPGMDRHLERLLPELEPLLDRNYRMFIHCNGGARSVAFALGILCTTFRLGFLHAYHLLMEIHPQYLSQPWHGHIAEVAQVIIAEKTRRALMAVTLLSLP